GRLLGGTGSTGRALGALGGHWEVLDSPPANPRARCQGSQSAANPVAGPLGGALSSRFGARPVAMIGGFLAGLGLLLGALANHLSHLYLSLGLLAGLGWALVFTPSLGAVGHYFPTRRALATGVAVSGASISGLALGPLVPFLLDTYGWRGALLLLAATSFNLLAAGALLRPPPPIPEELLDLPEEGALGLVRLLRHGPFLRFSLAFVLIDAGYYVPFVHGEALAHEIGCGGSQAGLAMAAMMVADGGGRLTAGWLATGLATPLLRQLLAWVVSGGLVLFLLPLGTSFGLLLALGLVYGFCAGAIVPLQFAGVAEVVGSRRLVNAIGLMQMFESLGSLLGPPLAG
ncbi:MOT13 protein, partial [Galbula dea]|nr:MOT13 protein [Galbula dea]